MTCFQRRVLLNSSAPVLCKSYRRQTVHVPLRFTHADLAVPVTFFGRCERAVQRDPRRQLLSVEQLAPQWSRNVCIGSCQRRIIISSVRRGRCEKCAAQPFGIPRVERLLLSRKVGEGFLCSHAAKKVSNANFLLPQPLTKICEIFPFGLRYSRAPPRGVPVGGRLSTKKD